MRIVFLDLDTLRPDHLSCYGYERETSPNLDRICRQGVRFDNYYCSDAPCLPSRTALMSGRFGIHTGVIGHGGTAADYRIEGRDRNFKSVTEHSSLPRMLREQGMKTTLISPFGERHSAFHFYAGFNEIHNTGKSGNESAEDVTPTVLDWIDKNAKDDNWYLHVNYWDPHTTYRAPESFGNPFENEPLPNWITPEILEEHQNHVGPHSAHEINMWDSKELPDFPRHVPSIKNMDELKKHLDGYDTQIRYLDRHLGQLFDALEKQGVMDDVAIIISSDHGENQGELGIYAEHATADHATCRIPMIIRWPGGQQGHVDTGLHHNLDLAPTLARLLDCEPHPIWDGQSYADTITNGAETGKDYLVLGQGCHTCQRSVRFGPWLYMRTYHDGFHMFPKEMLFHIEEDPYEQHNLAESKPEIVREAVYLLNEWHDQMMATQPDAVDPLWTVVREGGPFHARGRLKTYCKRLQATGRSWAIETLKQKHPQEFV